MLNIIMIIYGIFFLYTLFSCLESHNLDKKYIPIFIIDIALAIIVLLRGISGLLGA